MSREKCGDIEFMKALKASGFSDAVCESVNGIRKIIFENSNNAGELLLINSIVYSRYDNQNGWSKDEFAYNNKNENKTWANICDMERRAFANIQEIHRAIKEAVGLDDEEYISFTDTNHGDEGVVEIEIYFDSENVVPKDHPNISEAISIGFYYKKRLKLMN